MKSAVAFVIGAFVAAAAHSGPPDWRAKSEECAAKQDNAELAKCLRDGVAALTEQANAELKKANDAQMAKDKEPVKFLVRDTGASVSNFARFSVGDKGASLNVLRNKGEDATQANVALFAVFQPWGPHGQFQPFIGAAWSRDGAANPKKDIRQLTAGTTGPLLETQGEGWQMFSVLHTLQISRRDDRDSTTDGSVVRAQFDLSFNPLSSGQLLNGLQILPHVAGLWLQRTEGATARGRWTSAYAGLQAVLPFKFGEQPLKASLAARKLFDASVPDGNEKRRQHHVNFSLEYLFYNADDKSVQLQPSLFVNRETGLDFLEHGKATNKTTAGIRLKYN
jgi:hypothetical protein